MSSSSVLEKVEIESRGNGTAANNGNGNDAQSQKRVNEEIDAFLEAPFRFSDELRSLGSIVMFVTTLPVPKGIDLHPGFLMKGLCYFPVIGALLGVALAQILDFLSVGLQLPVIVAAAISIAVGWRITSCFHEDGLCDSADGFGGGWNRSQILKIMTDSRVGTYGCAALVIHTIIKVHLLAELGSSKWQIAHIFAGDHDIDYSAGCRGAGPALVVAHMVGRMTAPYLVHTRDYIDDEEGPKSSFYAFMIKAKYLDSRSRMLFAVLFSFVVAAAMYGPIASLSLITTTLLFGHLAGGYAERILGGVMGDFLGATICLSEVVVLVLLLIIQQNEGLIGSIDLSFLFGVPKSGETTVPSFEIGRGLAVVFDQCDYFVWVRLLVLICANIMWRTWVETSTVPTENGLENGTKDDPQEANPGAFTDPVYRKSCEIFSSPESTFVERFDAAMAYIDTLAKPVGSLGTLEIWASRLAALQRTMQPKINGIACLIFAGDHGVAAAPTEGGEGCSAYPQSVTKAILEGLRREVAGASVLAKANDIHLRVVDVGVIGEASKDNEFVVTSETKLLGGTGNFCIQPAMSAEECDRCIDNGRKYLTQYLSETSANVIALGEVGIGNTTSSSALLAALTGIGASEVDCLCDEGAYASKESTDAVVSRKISIVKKAMKKHYYKDMKPEVALATFGGAEISAMVGAILEASKNSVPVLLDGFIATAAALVAVHISPDVCRVLFFTTMSAEKGHKIAIEKIQTIAKKNNVIPDDKPVLSMGLRMGEGTAAILAAPILRSSVSILTEMATVQSILSLA